MLNDESDQYSDERGDLSISNREDELNLFMLQVKNQDSNVEIPYFLKKEKQPPNWHSVQEVINRQIGSNPLFHRRFYGSSLAVERLSLSHKFTANKNHNVTAFNFNQEGNLLASACAGNSEVFIWDWAVAKKRCFASGNTHIIRDVKWLPLNAERLVTCAINGVRLLNLNSNILEMLALYDDYQPQKLAVHPEMPNTVLTAVQEGKVILIDVREESRKKGIELLTVVTKGIIKLKINLRNIHFNPLNSNEFCVSGYCQYVRVYDRRQVRQPLYTLCPNHLRNKIMYHVRNCVYNHDGTEIVATYGPDEDIYLFDKINSSPAGYVHKYRGTMDAKEVVFFGPKSEYVISGSYYGYLYIWNKNTKALVQLLECENRNIKIKYLKAHPVFPILATQMDNDIGIWMPLNKKFPDKESFASTSSGE